MTPYKFASNPRPTLGVEIELNLVDARTMALRSGVFPILESLPAELGGVGQARALPVLSRDQHGICRRRGRGRARPDGEDQGRRRGRPCPGPEALLGRDPPVLALAGPGGHAQRALPRPGRPAPGDGAAADHFRPARPRRPRLGRQGDHDLRPDPAAPAHAPGPLGQQPVLERPRHRACTRIGAR